MLLQHQEKLQFKAKMKELNVNIRTKELSQPLGMLVMIGYERKIKQHMIQREKRAVNTLQTTFVKTFKQF